MNKNNQNGAVWVLAELKNGVPHPVSLQLIGKARILADKLGACVETVLLGEQLKEPARLLIESGADTVYMADSINLAVYQSDVYASILSDLVKQQNPEIFLLGSTFMGRELAPILAVKLETGLTAHCIDLVLKDNMVLDQQIPAYGGLISILCPERRPQMATVASGVFATPEPDSSRSGEIVNIELPSGIQNRARVLEIVKEETGKQSLEEATFIVAGGIGTGNEKGWNSLQELSETLRAALGCTRPVVDEGWAELETMIGQSGKMVSPQYYLGAGLSGELQHMVGIKGAQLMIAVNNDSKSPVFEQVDIGIIEDCATFIPLLVAKINEAKG